jgi:hypothetical protein
MSGEQRSRSWCSWCCETLCSRASQCTKPTAPSAQVAGRVCVALSVPAVAAWRYLSFGEGPRREAASRPSGQRPQVPTLDNRPSFCAHRIKMSAAELIASFGPAEPAAAAGIAADVAAAVAADGVPALEKNSVMKDLAVRFSPRPSFAPPTRARDPSPAARAAPRRSQSTCSARSLAPRRPPPPTRSLQARALAPRRRSSRSRRRAAAPPSRSSCPRSPGRSTSSLTRRP